MSEEKQKKPFSAGKISDSSWGAEQQPMAMQMTPEQYAYYQQAQQQYYYHHPMYPYQGYPQNQYPAYGYPSAQQFLPQQALPTAATATQQQEQVKAAQKVHAPEKAQNFNALTFNYDSVNPQPRTRRPGTQRVPAAAAAALPLSSSSGAGLNSAAVGSPSAATATAAARVKESAEAARKRVREILAKGNVKSGVTVPQKEASQEQPLVQPVPANLPKIPRKSAQLQVQQAAATVPVPVPVPVQSSVLISAARAHYPASLNAFIDRVLQNAHSAKDQQVAQMYVQRLITKAEKDGTLHTTDWENAPVPSLATSVKRQESPAKVQHMSLLQTSSAKVQASPAKMRASPAKVQEPLTKIQKPPPPPPPPPSKAPEPSPASTVAGSIPQKQRMAANLLQRGPSIPPTVPQHTKPPPPPPPPLEQQIRPREEKQKKKELPAKKRKMITAEIRAPPIQRPPSPILTTHNIGGAIVGTCTSIEKSFFRPKPPIDPSTVRPESILRKSLQHVKERYKQNADYFYLWEQLKSIRQDLFLQQIRNEFTVKVHEFHACLAIENNDLSEFNACQTRLSDLYHQGIKGHVFEFSAYKILYFVFTDSFSDLSRFLKIVPPSILRHKFVKHALQVNEAISLQNYKRLLTDLYTNAPKRSPNLMQLFLPKYQHLAFEMILKTNTGNLPIDFLQRSLGFTDTEECTSFLTEKEVIFAEDGMLNTKETLRAIR